MKMRSQKVSSSTGCFAGTASAYAEFRPNYPEKIIGAIVDTLDLKIGSRVLDIGCGSGLLSIPLSAHVAEVMAVDRDEEMIVVARRETAKHSIKNVKYLPMAGEEIDASIGKFDAAVFGNSFHWMDRKLVATTLRSLLSKEGSIAILTAFYIWHGKEAWKSIVREVITKYTGEDRSAGLNIPSGKTSDADILKEAGFVDVRTRSFTSQHQYSLQTLLGFLASTSYASHGNLGDKANDFEREISERLSNFDRSLLYDETVEYRELSRNGDMLEGLEKTVPWETFRKSLDKALKRSKREKGGRKPYDGVLMFKTLVLQALYNLSDEQTEYQIRDRLSFMRFLGLDPAYRLPRLPDRRLKLEQRPNANRRAACEHEALKRVRLRRPR